MVNGLLPSSSSTRTPPAVDPETSGAPPDYGGGIVEGNTRKLLLQDEVRAHSCRWGTYFVLCGSPSRGVVARCGFVTDNRPATATAAAAACLTGINISARSAWAPAVISGGS